MWVKVYKVLGIIKGMEMNEINDVTNFLFKNKITAHIDTKDLIFIMD